MSIEIIIAMVISIIVATAYITTLICNHESHSSWQVIAYTSSEVVVPKEIYICKNCYEKKDINYHYCPNCGARMTNGIVYSHNSGKIDILS